MRLPRDYPCTCLVVLVLGAYLGAWAVFISDGAWREAPWPGGSTILVFHAAPPTVAGTALYRVFLPLVVVNAYYRDRVYIYDLVGAFTPSGSSLKPPVP